MANYGSFAVPLVAGMLYYGAAWCGVNLFALESGAAILWPPNAVLLGFLLYFPSRWYWLSIVAACLLAEMAADFSSFTLLQSFLFGCVNALECLLAAFLLKYKGDRFQEGIDWADPRDLGLFFALVIFIVSPFCAVLGASVYKFQLFLPDSFTTLWRLWWFGDVTGLIVLTPLVLCGLKFVMEPGRTHSLTIKGALPWEMFAVVALSAASFYLVFFVNLDYRGLMSVTPLLLVLVPIAAAVRLSTDFTIVLSGLLAVFIALATRSGYGPFYTGSGLSTALPTQEFLVIYYVVILFVNAFVKQARNHTQDLKLYKYAMDSSGEGIVISGAEGDQPIIYCNRGFENLTGYREQEIIGRNCRFLNIRDRNFQETQLIKNAIESREAIEITLVNRRKNGDAFWNKLSIHPIANKAGKVTHFIGVQTDVTEVVEQRVELEKALQELNDLNSSLEEKVASRTRELRTVNRQLHELAVTDHMTGIFNRRRMMELGFSECERCRRRGHQLSVLMMDIDYFKRINDRWGHDAGDLVLQRFSDTISHAVREMDSFGRWGGEEFVLLLTESECIDVRTVAQKILNLISQMRVVYDGDAIPVSVSIGIARFDPLLSESFQSTVLKADKALYRAKKDGRGRVVEYEEVASGSYSS